MHGQLLVPGIHGREIIHYWLRLNSDAESHNKHWLKGCYRIPRSQIVQL